MCVVRLAVPLTLWLQTRQADTDGQAGLREALRCAAAVARIGRLRRAARSLGGLGSPGAAARATEMMRTCRRQGQPAGTSPR